MLILPRFIFSVLITISLLLLTTAVFAGNLYRYMDGDTQVLSHSLPPSVAQSGYDILDSKTLHLIRHVKPALTSEQLIVKYVLKEQEKLDELRHIQEQEEQKRQDEKDRILLLTYPSEQDLIERRDALLTYRQKTLAKTKEKQVKTKKNLILLQTQAAKDEIAGRPISESHYRRLKITQQQIDYNDKIIVRLSEEISQLTKKYDEQQQRIRFLLSQKNK